MRTVRILATAAAVAAGAPGCAHRPPPLPAEPPDVHGTVWTIQGSFESGGNVVVRPDAVPGQGPATADRLELRPGARIVLRRKGELHFANFSNIQLGEHVAAWWDGEPATDGSALVGPVRVLLIELDSVPRAGR